MVDGKNFFDKIVFDISRDNGRVREHKGACFRALPFECKYKVNIWEGCSTKKSPGILFCLETVPHCDYTLELVGQHNYGSEAFVLVEDRGVDCGRRLVSRADGSIRVGLEILKCLQFRAISCRTLIGLNFFNNLLESEIEICRFVIAQSHKCCPSKSKKHESCTDTTKTTQCHVSSPASHSSSISSLDCTHSSFGGTQSDDDDESVCKLDTSWRPWHHSEENSEKDSGGNCGDCCPSDANRPGSKGMQGEPGDPGKPGPKGVPGNVGPRGKRGCPGERGKRGCRGKKGATGPQGETGPIGATGPRGETGERGATGIATKQDIIDIFNADDSFPTSKSFLIKWGDTGLKGITINTVGGEPPVPQSFNVDFAAMTFPNPPPADDCYTLDDATTRGGDAMLARQIEDSRFPLGQITVVTSFVGPDPGDICTLITGFPLQTTLTAANTSGPVPSVTSTCVGGAFCHGGTGILPFLGATGSTGTYSEAGQTLTCAVGPPTAITTLQALAAKIQTGITGSIAFVHKGELFTEREGQLELMNPGLTPPSSNIPGVVKEHPLQRCLFCLAELFGCTLTELLNYIASGGSDGGGG